MDQISSEGLIIDVIRGSMHDGPGMRTTVFLKGCSLRCRWCQNPESINYKNQVWWDKNKCIGCLECVSVCPNNAVSQGQTRIEIDYKNCDICDECVKSCPANAMAFVGKQWTVEALVKEVEKDKIYYDEFGGGVTVSGGEPLLQAKFIKEFFKELHNRKITTALDTCGYAEKETLEIVLQFTDIILYDIKLMDRELSKEFTGKTNDLILENLLYIAEYIRGNDRDITLWIRTPLIPDATATIENITAISKFLKENIDDVVERWELCAFNGSCVEKYERLEQEWEYSEYKILKQHLVDKLVEAAVNAGMGRDKIFPTGITTQK